MAAADATSGTYLDECLLDRYLEILNRAVADTRGRFPFNVVLSTLREELAGRTIVVQIADSHDRLTAVVVCRFDGTRLLRGGDASALGESPATRWIVAREHVHDVVGRPWRYLADPMRFELPPFSLCSPNSSMCSPTRRHAVDDCSSCVTEGAPR